MTCKGCLTPITSASSQTALKSFHCGSPTCSSSLSRWPALLNTCYQRGEYYHINAALHSRPWKHLSPTPPYSPLLPKLTSPFFFRLPFSVFIYVFNFVAHIQSSHSPTVWFEMCKRLAGFMLLNFKKAIWWRGKQRWLHRRREGEREASESADRTLGGVLDVDNTLSTLYLYTRWVFWNVMTLTYFMSCKQYSSEVQE